MSVPPVIVVIGGAGLIGSAICRGAAASGAVCIVADIDQERGAHVVEQIVREGGAAQFLRGSAGDSEDVEALTSGVFDQWGVIDALVNCSYPSQLGQSVEHPLTADAVRRAAEHLSAFVLPTEAFARRMSTAGGGSIVNLSSIYGQFAPKFALYEGTSMTVPVEYAIAKAGIDQMTRYLAQQYKSAGVRINAVAPGGIRNGQPSTFQDAYDAMCGKRGMLEVDDVVGPVLFLASDAARAVTGQVLVVDDGWSL